MIMKIAYGRQIHLYKGVLDLQCLKNHCQNVFKDLPKFYDFYYIDSDTDHITISSHHDLIALEHMDEDKAIKKLYIQESEDDFEPF